MMKILPGCWQVRSYNSTDGQMKSEMEHEKVKFIDAGESVTSAGNLDCAGC